MTRRSGYDRRSGLTGAVLALVTVMVCSCTVTPHQAHKLTDLAELQATRAVNESPICTSTVSVSPTLAEITQGHVEAVGDDMVINGDDGDAYCIYRIGPFAPRDGLAGVSVSTNWLDESDLSYEIGIADFGAGQWVYSTPITQGQTRQVALPELAQSFNHAGELFVAVVVRDRDAALVLTGLEVEMDLVEGQPSSISPAMLDFELAGVPVAIPLTVLDENNRIVSGYAEVLRLAIAGNGYEATVDAGFAHGTARPVVTFPGPGPYGVTISGSSGGLDRDLGTIQIYESNLPVYSLRIEDETLNCLNNNIMSDQYQPARLQIADGRIFEASVHYRGKSRRMLPKRGWKVKLKDRYADEEWGYNRDNFNLITDPADTTMLREKLSYDLMLDLGVPAPRSRFIHLRLNDRFQGVFIDVENPRKSWLKAMGLDNDGALYKAELGNLGRLGQVSDYETRFEKATREDEAYNDLAGLCDWLDQLTGSDPAVVEQAIADRMFLDELVSYLVGLTLISSRDNWGHNYYLYHDLDATGKWLITPWDMDLTWGFDSPGRIPADDPIDMRAGNNVLTKLFFSNRHLMERNNARLAEALENVFTVERMNRVIDGHVAEIGPDVRADWQKKGTYTDFLERSEALKTYVQDRREFLLNEIANS